MDQGGDMTKRDRQAAEYAADQEGDMSDDSNKRWKTCVTNSCDAAGVTTYTLVGTVVKLDGQDYVRVGESLHALPYPQLVTPAGWHATEAAALRDAAARVAEIHAAIGAQLARLLRGER
jgi:hypothetical protein